MPHPNLPVCQPAPTPHDETARLSALYDCSALDLNDDPELDAITQEACTLCHSSIAHITLIDRHTRHSISRQGTNEWEVPREISICAHAILNPKNHPFIVLDSWEDKRFSENPRVLGPPYIRFYLGVPLTLSSGHKIGTLCVMDPTPRSSASIAHVRGLQLLANKAVVLIEHNSKKYNSVDQKVGLQIQRQRVKLGFSPEFLEEKLIFQPGEISQVERGAKRIPAAKLLQLTHVLGVKISYFFS